MLPLELFLLRFWEPGSQVEESQELRLSLNRFSQATG